jgi:phosphoglycerate dehydrogenase-like enzyme
MDRYDGPQDYSRVVEKYGLAPKHTAPGADTLTPMMATVITVDTSTSRRRTLVTLDELLARSDVITLHLALNDDTRGFLGPEQVARMKPGVILINTARGAFMDEGALIDGLRSGRIRHAGLDVFHHEPLKPDHPLAGMENVTLTAHAEFRTPEASATLLRRAIDLVRSLAGVPVI